MSNFAAAGRRERAAHAFAHMVGHFVVTVVAMIRSIWVMLVFNWSSCGEKRGRKRHEVESSEF